MKKSVFLKTFVLIQFILVSANSGLYAQWVNNGERMSYALGNHHHPVIAATKEGGAYITWVNSDSTSTGFYGNILLNGLDAQGNVMAGFPFHGITVTTVDNQWAPFVLTSEDDLPILVWQGRNAPNAMIHIYAQKYTRAGTPIWNGGQPITICPTDNNQDQYPIVVSDKHKGFYVTWNRFDSLQIFELSDIWLEHIDSTGNVAKGWDTTGTAVANLPTYQYYPQLVLSNDESAVYVMFSSGDIGASKLLLKKYNTSDGTQVISNLWGANGLEVSPGPYLYLNINTDQFIYCDNQDNVVLFWSETRYTLNGEVYMQRISPTGEVLLTGGGKYLTGQNNGNGTGWMEASQDPFGNFLITCNDYTSGDNIDALMVEPNGKIIWQYLSKNNLSVFPKPISDGNKGMYVFFKYETSPSTLLHVIAIDSTGNLYKSWNITGSNYGEIDQHTLFSPQYDFTITSAGTGRGLVTWNRLDGNMFNVYACNLRKDGTNCDYDATANVKELTNINSIAVFPNPFSSVISIQLSVVSNQHLSFKLYDIRGKLIQENSINSNSTEIRTTCLSNGMYFYNIFNDETSLKRGKLIKEL